MIDMGLVKWTLIGLAILMVVVGTLGLIIQHIGWALVIAGLIGAAIYGFQYQKRMHNRV